MTAVRCHAALIADSDRCVTTDDWEERGALALGKIFVKNNIVVTYDASRLPTEGVVTVVDHCGAEVLPFTGECHSTVDFNGIVRIHPDRLTFIPMHEVTDYLK